MTEGFRSTKRISEGFGKLQERTPNDGKMEPDALLSKLIKEERIFSIKAIYKIGIKGY